MTAHVGNPLFRATEDRVARERPVTIDRGKARVLEPDEMMEERRRMILSSGNRK
jgi:hypothetical protein